jgi:hypothetical protein
MKTQPTYFGIRRANIVVLSYSILMIVEIDITGVLNTGLSCTQLTQLEDIFLMISSSLTWSFCRKRYIAFASESLAANRRIECTLLENKRLRIKLPLFINRLSFIS